MEEKTYLFAEQDVFGNKKIIKKIIVTNKKEEEMMQFIMKIASSQKIYAQPTFTGKAYFKEAAYIIKEMADGNR